MHYCLFNKKAKNKKNVRLDKKNCIKPLKVVLVAIFFASYRSNSERKYRLWRCWNPGIRGEEEFVDNLLMPPNFQK
jgi:hypothetical protein